METERKTIFQDHSSSSFFSFVILVSLMFDIKDVEIVFPDAVYSVIINLPCKTSTFGAKPDTKGPSLDLWCRVRKDWKEKITKKQKNSAMLPPNYKCELPDGSCKLWEAERERREAQSDTQRKRRWGFKRTPSMWQLRVTEQWLDEETRRSAPTLFSPPSADQSPFIKLEPVDCCGCGFAWFGHRRSSNHSRAR